MEKQQLPPNYLPPSHVPAGGQVPQCAMPQPSMQPIIVQVAPRPSCCSGTYPAYKDRQSLKIGIVLILSTVMCFILAAVAFGLMMNRYEYYGQQRSLNRESVAHTVMPGVWTFLFVLPAGILAICAAKKKSKCTIVAYLVMSIIGAVFAFIMWAIAIWAVTEDANRVSRGFYYEFSDGYDQYGPDGIWIRAYREQRYSDKAAHRARGLMALSTLLLICSTASLVCCIWGAVLCCQAVCCGRAASEVVPNVQYTAGTQPQVMVIGYPGHPGQMVPTVPVGSQGQQTGQTWQHVQGPTGQPQAAGFTPPPEYTANSGSTTGQGVTNPPTYEPLQRH